MRNQESTTSGPWKTNTNQTDLADEVFTSLNRHVILMLLFESSEYRTTWGCVGLWYRTPPLMQAVSWWVSRIAWSLQLLGVGEEGGMDSGGVKPNPSSRGSGQVFLGFPCSIALGLATGSLQQSQSPSQTTGPKG